MEKKQTGNTADIIPHKITFLKDPHPPKKNNIIKVFVLVFQRRATKQ